MEELAILFVMGSIVAIFVTLVPYNGRQLPDWPYRLSVGALLSAYVVVLRLAINTLLGQGIAQLKWRWLQKDKRPLYDLALHDGATRGPAGASTLLTKFSLPNSWQWMGCMLIMLILPVGPITQLALHYDQCEIPIDATSSEGGSTDASIPRSSIFMGQGVRVFQGILTRRDTNDEDFPPPLISLTLDEQIAVSAGMFSAGSVGNVCSSGNCTYPSYGTIGYCAQCEDIASQVKIDTLNETDFGDGAPKQGLPHVQTNSSIPNGLSITYDHRKNPLREVGASVTSDFAISGVVGQSFQILIGLPGEPIDPVTGDPPKGCETPEQQATWRCHGYGAASCNLIPCARTYKASTTNGQFQETMTSTETAAFSSDNGRWFDGLTVPSALNTSCLTDQEQDALRAMGYKIEDGGGWMPYNFTACSAIPITCPSCAPGPSTIATLEQVFLDRGCLYIVDSIFGNGLLQYLSDTMAGTLTGRSVDNELLFDPRVTGLRGPQLLTTVYNYGNFSFERTQSIFDNISISLTNHMRLDPGVDDLVQDDLHTPPQSYSVRGMKAPARGQASTTKTCLTVRWGWLVFPTALALLTLIFFFGVMLTSGKLFDEVRSWKSSPLPLLFFGFHTPDGGDPDLADLVSQDMPELEEKSKKIEVVLVQDEAGFAMLRKLGKQNDTDAVDAIDSDVEL